MKKVKNSGLFWLVGFIVMALLCIAFLRLKYEHQKPPSDPPRRLAPADAYRA